MLLNEKQSVLEYANKNSKKYRSYRRFLRGITSMATKASNGICGILWNFTKLSDYDRLAKSETEQIDILIEDYI